MNAPPDNPRRIGIVANPEKPACRTAARRALDLIRRSGRTAILDAATASLMGVGTHCPTPRSVALESDVLLVLGGDGTILRMARETAGTGTPLLGINVGNLGFLTAASVSHLPAALRALRAGHYHVEPRPLIEATLRPPHTGKQLALNDFVIARGGATRLIELEVLVNGEKLTRYRCDGLIVSSPTGSTAYSMAAGGAIITPDSEVFAITPISPHTLSNRPVIVSLRSTILVQVLSSRVPVDLSSDGQVQTQLQSGDQVSIRRSRRSVSLVHLQGTSFFTTLQRKLHWSGSPV